MVDLALTEEQQMIRAAAADFARRRVRPVADAIYRARGAIGAWELVRPVFREASQQGFTRVLIPVEHGGVGGSCMDAVLILEELGAADHGIAASYFNVSMTAPAAIRFGGSEAQRQTWLNRIAQDPECVLASASSEANVAGADSFYPGADPRVGLKTTARLDGAHYVLSGAKSGFSTNAGAARLFFVMARTGMDAPARASTSMFIVPADSPGITIGGKTELIGWKTALHHEVLFDEVRVPVENRIGAEGANAAVFFLKTLPYLAAGFAATFVGLARAAFELAFDYAHERRSWGQPIIEHQAVALKLADMAAEIEAARLMVWRLATAADAGDPQAAGFYAPAAKTLAVDTAIRCAERAIKVMGGYGVAADYGAGRLLNDAWIGDSCDGTHDMLRLNIVQFLRMSRGRIAPPGLPPEAIGAMGGPPPGFPPGAPPGFPPGPPAGAPPGANDAGPAPLSGDPR